MNCEQCGSDNKGAAIFCKKCGANLKDKNNVICRINSHINILAVLIGLFVAVIILFVCTFLFVGIIKNYSLPAYIGLVLFTMVLIGSIFTGALGNESEKDGMINGGIVSLIILLFTSFIIGILLLAVMGIGGLFASYLGNAGTSASTLLNSTTSTTGSDLSSGLFYLLEYVMGIVVIFLAGILGGTFGVYLKEALN